MMNSNKMPLRKFRGGQSVASVARELGVTEGVLHKWKRARLSSASDAEREVIEMRKKLREVEMERDILKKAATNRTAGEVGTLSVH